MPRFVPIGFALLALAAPAAADPLCVVVPAWREVATGVYVERPVLRCTAARPVLVERTRPLREPCDAPAARPAALPPVPSPLGEPEPARPLRWETPRLLTNR
jgi:hypothetical protein